MTNLDYQRQPIYPANELDRAVSCGLLTLEEARTVYWAQFPELRDRASRTAPPIEKAV